MLNDVDERSMMAKRNVQPKHMRYFIISLIAIALVTVFMVLGFDAYLQSIVEDCIEDPSTPGIEILMTDEYGLPFCMRDWRG